jgi:hypothetical protein
MKFKELLLREEIVSRTLGARFSVDSARYLTCFIGFSAFGTGFLRDIGRSFYGILDAGLRTLDADFLVCLGGGFEVHWVLV